MKIIDNAPQGSEVWLDLRLSHFPASEAAAMLGESKHMKRSELLRMKTTGDKKEVSDFVQKHVFDKGHEVEDKARAILEDELGVELYPVTGSKEVDGLPLLASYDGHESLSEEWSMEHKQWNKDLPAKVEAGEFEPDHYWQMEHQIVVGDLEYVLFVVSDGTTDNRVMAKYYSVPERRERLIAGWKQFAEDLKNYVVPEVKVEVTGTAIEELPTLAIQITGEVQSSNLEAFEHQAEWLLSNVRKELTTDQHFADADKIVKFCGVAEKDIDAAKKSALAQTATIDDLFRRLDHIKAQLRDTRLDLGKQVTAEKANRKQAIIDKGYSEVNAHHGSVIAELDGYEPNTPSPDLRVAAKNKRTLESLQDSVDTAVANWKIEIGKQAAIVAKNVALLRKNKEHKALLMDADSWVNKEPEYVEMLIQKRITEHEAAEKAKAEAAAEAERERIRAEEQAKAQSEAEAQAEAERERIRQEEAEKLAKQAFVAAGLNEELAKTVVKLVAMGKVPGMAMLYPNQIPEANREAA